MLLNLTGRTQSLQNSGYWNSVLKSNLDKFVQSYQRTSFQDANRPVPYLIHKLPNSAPATISAVFKMQPYEKHEVSQSEQNVYPKETVASSCCKRVGKKCNLAVCATCSFNCSWESSTLRMQINFPNTAFQTQSIAIIPCSFHSCTCILNQQVTFPLSGWHVSSPSHPNPQSQLPKRELQIQANQVRRKY